MTKPSPRQTIDITQDHTYADKSAGRPALVRTGIKIPKYHWRRDRPDARDYVYGRTGQPAANIVDLRPYCSPVENQFNLGSCTGQAIAGAIELLNKRTGKYRDISRLFIYYWERYLIGTVNYDSGAYIRDGIKVTNKWGASLESLWPYIVARFRDRPNSAALADGQRRRATRYERILDFDGAIDALNQGFPVVMGFLVYESFERASVAKTGIMPYPEVNRERMLGGHAVLLVGYDRARGVFIARNSWGAGWGDRGYFYMPFAVVKNTSMSFDFWVIKAVENP